MTKFRTKYSRVETFTPAGSPVYDELVGKYDDQGILVLDKVGVKNLYNEIQSHADSVDINNIIRRYESGEVDVLTRAQGVFADVSMAPKSYAEMLNLMRSAEQIFDQLPADVRAEYDNSFEQFFAQDGLERLMKPVESVSAEKDAVVKENENNEP